MHPPVYSKFIVNSDMMVAVKFVSHATLRTGGAVAWK